MQFVADEDDDSRIFDVSSETVVKKEPHARPQPKPKPDDRLVRTTLDVTTDDADVTKLNGDVKRGLISGADKSATSSGATVKSPHRKAKHDLKK